MFDVLLAQFHEEFITGNVLSAQGIGVVEAIADDHHRLTFHPGAEARTALHRIGGEAIEAEQGGEDRENGQERDILVKGHVASGGTEGEDDQDFEQRQLAHAAPAGKTQESEDQDEGAHRAQDHFAEEGEGELVEEDALPVERIHRQSAPCIQHGPMGAVQR
ncbi:hypothetical protein D9M71_687200 [compost metagenome]